MEIIFSAPQKGFANALRTATAELAGVSVAEASILDLTCDAVVSPANSYGFMDGGLDALYTAHFGEIVQTRVRERILYDHHGELLIGAATIVPTDQAAIPFLIAAPTMRVPMSLGEVTANPFLAMRAVILLVRHGIFPSGPYQGEPIGSVVKRVAVPGLGTGVGNVPFDICAKQVAQAIRHCRDAPHRLPRSWAEASEDHIRLYSDKIAPLQR